MDLESTLEDDSFFLASIKDIKKVTPPKYSSGMQFPSEAEEKYYARVYLDISIAKEKVGKL